MDQQRLDHFRSMLLEQLRQHEDKVRANQNGALQMREADDGVKDAADMSVQDLNQELEFRLGERESQIVADIDQALLRIEEGSYGICERCEKPINERRLEAIPTARYDAECQTIIEASQGLDDISTL